MLFLTFLTWLVFTFTPVYAAGTRVIKTNTGPTGYEVTFVFTPPNVSTTYTSVLLGGFARYSNPLGASGSKTNAILPSQWKPDDFSMNLIYDANHLTYSGFNMTYSVKTGDWTVTLPFPSGTFNYAFYPDCKRAWGPSTTCAKVVDPSNPPIERRPGDQTVSTIQVPFDGRFQKNNYDWLLPLPLVQDRGSVSFHTYPIKGNATFMSAAGVYLPREYGTVANKTYPTLYLQHGGGGTESDWFSQGRAQNLMDQLIESGTIEPTVIIAPNLYDLPFTPTEFFTPSTWGGNVVGQNTFFNLVREVYIDSLVPWVEQNYAVSHKPSSRAFAGLSLGGGMALTMLFNATKDFGSFGIWSPTPSPNTSDPVYSNSALRKVGIFTGAGFYDHLMNNSRFFQNNLDSVGIVDYYSHFPLNGAHQWSTWQEILNYYLRYALWKPTPYVLHPQQGPFDLSGGVPY